MTVGENDFRASTPTQIPHQSIALCTEKARMTEIAHAVYQLKSDMLPKFQKIIFSVHLKPSILKF